MPERRRRWRALLGVGAVLLTVAAGCSDDGGDEAGDAVTSESTIEGTVVPTTSSNPTIAAAQALASPGLALANDWQCRAQDGADPIVLVHGTSRTGAQNFSDTVGPLTDAGYCVFALDYGKEGTDALEASAAQLATFVQGVLAATAASQVDILGHSQGGLMPRYYIKSLGGAAVVDDFIAIAPPNHGSELAEPICDSCAQMAPDSAFLAELNAGAEVVEGVDYTVIATANDRLVVPYTSGFLEGPAEQVTNWTLEELCPGLRSNHGDVLRNPVSLQLIFDALSRPGPADPEFRPTC